jgi:hypothetical protein
LVILRTPVPEIAPFIADKSSLGNQTSKDS